jgi:hypothetical protein
VRAQVGEVKLANTLVTEIVDLFRGPVVVAVHAHQLVEQRSLLVHGCRGKRVRRKRVVGELPLPCEIRKNRNPVPDQLLLTCPLQLQLQLKARPAQRIGEELDICSFSFRM